MKQAKTFRIQIENNFSSENARSYFVYDEAPMIIGGGHQQNDIIRTVCTVANNVEHGGHKNFYYSTSCFGFIGTIRKEPDGRKFVDSEMECPVELGDARDNGTCLEARIPQGLKIKRTKIGTSEKGSFTIRCMDPLEWPHNIVVGLVRKFGLDGTLITAVRYIHGTDYKIFPRDSVYLLRDNMATGQVLPIRKYESGECITFRGTQTEIHVTENEIGEFSMDAMGFDLPIIAGKPVRKVAAKPTAIVIMGLTGSGKSTFIKQLTGLDIAVSDGIDSTTTEVNIYPTNIDSTSVCLMDTPGFDDSSRDEAKILKAITMKLAQIYEESTPIKGIIYIHDITIEKMTGSARRYFTMFGKIVGQDSLQNVTILTTKWDHVEQEKAEVREKQLQNGPWKQVIESGATVRRIDTNKNQDAYAEIARELLQHMQTTLDIQKELVDEHLPLNKTGAGRMVEERVQEETAAVRMQLKVLRALGRKVKDDDKEEKEQLSKELAEWKEKSKVLEAQFSMTKEKENKIEAELEKTQQEMAAIKKIHDEQQQQLEWRETELLEKRRQHEAQEKAEADARRQKEEQRRRDRLVEYELATNESLQLFKRRYMVRAADKMQRAFEIAVAEFGTEDPRTIQAKKDMNALRYHYIGMSFDKS